MRRRLLRIAVAVSFVLCVAIHIVWLRSYFYSERIAWEHRGAWRSFRTAAGQLEISLLVADWSKKPAGQLRGPKYDRGPVQPPFNHLLEHCHSAGDQRMYWERGGFAWYSILNFKQGQHDAIVVAPFWFLAAAAAFLPLVTTSLGIWRRGSGVGNRESGVGLTAHGVCLLRGSAGASPSRGATTMGSRSRMVDIQSVVGCLTGTCTDDLIRSGLRSR